MKFLLIAINAKYIHSNLGIYSLKAYAEESLEIKVTPPPPAGQRCSDESLVIEIGEYTINHQIDAILKDIYKRQPAVVGFSCYIWNVGYVLKLVRDLHKVLPYTEIWLGGPEVSYNAREVLEREPEVRGIMMGEGEETFAQLISYYRTGAPKPEEIDAAVVRTGDGKIAVREIRPAMDMSRIPFSYHDMTGFEHKIIYYESSRGCPFSCSYCLSSIDKSVRFRDLKLVLRELDFFLEHKVPQVKFVDRTFNCKKSHSMAIWKHILDHDNGVTNFHFEISADLISQEELELMSRMRPGLIQLEIGVQTTNQLTIREIRRTMDLKKLRQVVDTVNGFHNIHQHLDLIAGLPYEDFESFRRSFNDVYSMKPSQLQLGFLKVLKGSYMEEMAGEYSLEYKGTPPYEVLATRWLGYGEILRLKAVEEMTEVYYNSGQFQNTLKELEHEFETPFDMFTAMAEYYEAYGLFDCNHNRLARYELLYEIIRQRAADRLEVYRDLLMYDLYLRENLKSRPSFAGDQSPYKLQVRDFFIRESKTPSYLKGYDGCDSRQMAKMAHIEVLGGGRMILFDYLNREPLYHNAADYYVGIAAREES